MKYLSVCSGIEAATSAWHHMGWEAVAFSEIEKFPCEILKTRFPNVPNLGDMNEHERWDIDPIDLLVGGTPCQSFSVAGLRKGLSDPRGGLMLRFLEIARSRKPRWIVWENVPGVLSSHGGRDFGTFLGGLGELGYGWAYRVLDASGFGVPQRRRRVFVVGCLGDQERAAKVLFKSESVSRDTAKSRGKKKAASREAQERSGSGGEQDGVTLYKPQNFGDTGGGYVETDVTNTLDALQGSKQRHVAVQAIPLDLRNACRDPKKMDAMNRQGLGVGSEGDPSNTITSACVHGVAQPAVVYSFDSKSSNSMKSSNPHSGCREVETIKTLDTSVPDPSKNQGGSLVMHPATFEPGAMSRLGGYYWEDICGTLRKEPGDNQMSLHHSMIVRKLTPIECERLQGFPDNWTQIPYRGKPAEACPDGPRYKAIGNSMCVNVMRWIGERVESEK